MWRIDRFVTDKRCLPTPALAVVFHYVGPTLCPSRLAGEAGAEDRPTAVSPVKRPSIMRSDHPAGTMLSRQWAGCSRCVHLPFLARICEIPSSTMRSTPNRARFAVSRSNGTVTSISGPTSSTTPGLSGQTFASEISPNSHRSQPVSASFHTSVLMLVSLLLAFTGLSCWGLWACFSALSSEWM